ncbi:MAG: DUF2191 domain-containing protein [Acidobacteria bacterium]|nr:DUF2191 domain-containing protein [Acidobacteriota bacterium]
MKTTLNLGEDLMRAAKKTAAERGVTLTSLVEDALRAALTPAPASRRFQLRLPTVRGRRAPTVDIGDRDALLERMEGRL